MTCWRTGSKNWRRKVSFREGLIVAWDRGRLWRPADLSAVFVIPVYNGYPPESATVALSERVEWAGRRVERG